MQEIYKSMKESGEVDEFKKQKEDAAMDWFESLYERELCCYKGFRDGAEWAREWVLKNDPVVKDLVNTLNFISDVSGNGHLVLDCIRDYKAAIDD